MTPRLVLPALVVVLLAAPQAHADPLICVNPGAVDVGPYSVDPPEVCLL